MHCRFLLCLILLGLNIHGNVLSFFFQEIINILIFDDSFPRKKRIHKHSLLCQHYLSVICQVDIQKLNSGKSVGWVGLYPLPSHSLLPQVGSLNMHTYMNSYVAL